MTPAPEGISIETTRQGIDHRPFCSPEGFGFSEPQVVQELNLQGKAEAKGGCRSLFDEVEQAVGSLLIRGTWHRPEGVILNEFGVTGGFVSSDEDGRFRYHATIRCGKGNQQTGVTVITEPVEDKTGTFKQVALAAFVDGGWLLKLSRGLVGGNRLKVVLIDREGEGSGEENYILFPDSYGYIHITQLLDTDQACVSQPKSLKPSEYTGLIPECRIRVVW